MPAINIALIGYKFMGKAHSNAYRQVRRFFPGKLVPRMKVVCGRTRRGVEAAAREYGWEEVETDWQRVVERKDVDVVDVSTPGYLHAEQAIAAAAAGKHVICEKPLANTLDQARAMLRAVEKARVHHFLMHNYRKIPAVVFARKLIEGGRLGRIYRYRGAYLQDWILDPKFPLVWRLEKKFAGSGALGDIGSHAIDLARCLNGEFESVMGELVTFIKERPLASDGAGSWGAKGSRGKGRVTVDDDASFLARFRNGSVGVFEASRFCGGRRNFNTFQIYGSNGSLAFNLERMDELDYYAGADAATEQGFRTISVTERDHPYMSAWWPPGHIIGYEHTFIHAIHDFLAGLETGRLAEPNFYDGVKNQAVMEAVARSAKSGKWEKAKA